MPFVAANGTRYYGGSNGCAGMAPEAANSAGQALPSNTTYGAKAAQVLELERDLVDSGLLEDTPS